ncbi:MAG: hypothetical protein JW856_06220 [Dehalococcoidales bacterium]|nr:hypothetical protein [Dehalococcoidales bacterium]
MDLLIIVLGGLLVILASVLQAYCEFGRQSRPEFRPRIFSTFFRYIMEAGWIVLMLGGCVMVFFFGWLSGLGWIPGVIAVVGFWLVLPFLITPIMRHRILPPWDEVKAELEPKGYNERDYWRGDWWMKDVKTRRRKR